MSLPILEPPEEKELAVMRADASMIADEDCLSWHKYCEAECCKRFGFVDEGQDLSKKYLFLVMRLSPDKLRYYELHGCHYRNGVLRVPTRNAVRYGGNIIFREICDFLTEENRCRFHGTNKQPRVCRELSMTLLRSVGVHSGMTLTPRCLFKFKMEGGR